MRIPAILAHGRIISATMYLGAAALSLAAAALGLRLWNADLSRPFCYQSDAIAFQTWIKATIDHGWYQQNPSLGAPFGASLYDFPIANQSQFLMIKAIARFGPGGVAATTNLFFLLSFPLAALAATWALRRLNFRRWHALAGGVLFGVVPYHFARGEHHLLLASYFIVPLLVVVAVGALRRPVWLFSRGEDARRWPRQVPWANLAICALAGIANVYYAFFGCFLIAVAGVAAAISRRSLIPLANAGVYTACVVVVLACGLIPNLRYYQRHGRNPDVAQRAAWEADVYGLKINEMLLPIQGHRAAPLARLKGKFLERPPSLRYSVDYMTLGLVGTVGLILLLGRLLFLRRDATSNRLDALAVLAAAALLLGTAGGFGSLFNLLVSPLVRCYDRISIFIAFLSLAAVLYVAQNLLQNATGHWRRLYGALPLLLLALGCWDQLPTTAPNYAQAAASWDSDGAFVQQIETLQPNGGMVFQTPHIPFPEGAFVYQASCYDACRPYLHASHTRWSGGAIRGRASDRWLQRIAALPPEQQASVLSQAGFTGVCVDRFGYADQGAEVERAFTALLRMSPTLSPDGRLAFFDLRPWTDNLKSRYTLAQWKRQQRLALQSLR